MRKFAWLLGFALLIGIGSRTPAQAQGDTDLTRDWDLRAGFFIPERGAARAAEGDLWFTIGVERTFYESDRYTGTISIDYYGSGSVYAVPVMFNLRTVSNRLRYGAGAGLAPSHDLNRGILAFTYNLMVGYEVMTGRNPLNADVRYIFSNTSGGALNGWAFTIGGHF